MFMTACKQQEIPEEQVEFATTEVKVSDAEINESYSASIRGQQDVEIYPQVSGTISQLRVQEGQKVQKGEVLFVIDQVPYLAAVQTANANVNAAQAEVETAKLLYDSKKITPTTLEFVDIAGLVKGASKGEGLGNKFLSHIREVDAIVHVVRCFDDENIIHVEGTVDPVRDMETINLELIFADLETLDRRIAKAQSMLKADKKYAEDAERLDKMKAWLEAGKPLRSLPMDEEFKAFADEQFLLTGKPVIYVANVDESGLGGNAYTERVTAEAAKEGAECVVLCAKLEEDLSELDDEERAMFMEEYGLKESGLDKLVKASYKLLGLISYLTAGEKETRAWTIVKGTKAPQAAGKIHSDFEKGFIRAEIVDYETLLECGSFAAAKEKGKVRSEGKDYVMRENDVVLFRFNV